MSEITEDIDKILKENMMPSILMQLNGGKLDDIHESYVAGIKNSRKEIAKRLRRG
jgi:hypothetical protein